MSLFKSIRDYFKEISSSPAQLPEVILVPPSNTDLEPGLLTSIVPDTHYFTIRVNELYLKNQMEWFNTIEPTVLSLAEFQYDGKTIEQATVVGPSMLSGKIEKVPDGMLFNDTRVAGLHPFSGGRINLSIVLCKSKTHDGLRSMLELIGKISGLFNNNMSKLISQYIETTRTIVDGVDVFFRNGDLNPVMGYRKEFDIDANDKLLPGYFVLLNKPVSKWEKNKFYIKENKLYYGDSSDKATAFRELEYILFSITKTDRREDYKSLPFYETYKQILVDLKKLVGERKFQEEDKIEILNRLTALSFEMELSPDLTSDQAINLCNVFKAEIKKHIEGQVVWSAAGSKEENAWTALRSEIRTL